MARLSAEDILSIWEGAVVPDPVGRALTILGAASPGTPRETLAALPLGRRDAKLLEILEETFGPTLDGIASCPQCAEQIQFILEIPDLRARVGPATEPTEGDLRLDDWRLRYRLPASSDLAAAAACGDSDAARHVLAQRCVREAWHKGTRAEAEDVPADVFSQMALAMAVQDPWAEVLMGFVCPACGQEGQTLFDIAEYLWDNVCSHARRLLYEVHALARAYGWREADILTMSAVRRRAYLEMAV